MNKKAQVTYFVGFMIAIVVIVMALALAFPVREGSDNAMSSMNCTNSSISDYIKAGCYVTDLSPVFFIGGLIAIAGIIFAAKILFG